MSDSRIAYRKKRSPPPEGGAFWGRIGGSIASQADLAAALTAAGTGASTAIWGGITGTLSAQTDLLSALNAKEALGAVAAHAALGDPHPGYLTPAEGNAAYEAAGSVAAHAGLSDPHAVYQRETEKGSANGYAGLDGAGLVPVAQLPGIPAAWGAITGVLSLQTDLQTALNGKAATAHNHDATYQPLSSNLTEYAAVNPTAAGLALLDDADAPAQRATLGLGTLATQNGTFSGTSSGTNTGDQTITLTGNVTGSGTGSFAATIAAGVVTETMQVLADNTTQDVSITKHGYVPKAPGGTSQFLRADATWATPAGGGGGGSGTATLDFGAFPGKSDASVAVTGQTGIVSGSLVQAWMRPVASADHSADEHMLETLAVFAGNIVAGTGFTIYGINSDKNISGQQNTTDSRGYGGGDTRIYGAWTIAWRWS